MLQSLALNHCFIDGNKRVAFALTAIFLRMNGWNLIVNAEEGENFLIDRVIQGKAGLEEIAPWLESKMKALS